MTETRLWTPMIAGLGLVAAFVLSTSPSQAGPNCTCRANGETYLEGQFACIKLSSGDYTAQCSSVLNNTAWVRVTDGCPNATLQTDEDVTQFKG